MGRLIALVGQPIPSAVMEVSVRAREDSADLRMDNSLGRVLSVARRMGHIRVKTA